MNSHDRCNTCQEEQQEQDVGLNYDPCLPSPSAEPIPQDLGCSRQGFKQDSVQSKPSGPKVEDFVWEMERRASHQDTLDAILGHSSIPQEASHRHLGIVRECMLRDWFQSQRNTVWMEALVNSKLEGLTLVPEQQSTVDSGICLDRWALGRTQAQQPFNIG